MAGAWDSSLWQKPKYLSNKELYLTKRAVSALALSQREAKISAPIKKASNSLVFLS